MTQSRTTLDRVMFSLCSAAIRIRLPNRRRLIGHERERHFADVLAAFHYMAGGRDDLWVESQSIQPVAWIFMSPRPSIVPSSDTNRWARLAPSTFLIESKVKWA